MIKKRKKILPGVLKDLCLLAEIKVTIKWLKTLTDEQRTELAKYAAKVHLVASDNNIRLSARPEFLKEIGQ